MTKFSTRLNGTLLHMLRVSSFVQVWGDLCLTEMLKIMKEDPELLLNKQSELVSKYRHKNKLILANIMQSFPYDMHCNWK